MGHSALALGASAFPGVFGANAAVTLVTRPEWQQFKTTPRYDSLLKAVRLMKANTNANDPKSWTYWTNAHVKYCPHSVPYFLAWHRGYLYYFEKQLRTVSGDSALILPYWDYYSYATLPAEFTNSSSTNPLYVSRVNTNVRQALTMAPFSSTLINFQRGTSNAFEPSLEGAPHNPVHDIIGGWMADMKSPTDPIFWLHHANIDRLWVAWVSAGSGRKMPVQTNSYWSGSHTYASGLTMKRSDTYSTQTVLGYRYANETFPTKLPLAQATLSPSNIRRVQAKPGDLLGTIPAIGSFRLSTPRETSPQTFAVGGVLDVGLDERSVSAQLPVSGEHSRVLSEISKGRPAAIPGRGKSYRSMHLILDGIETTEEGRQGGYFYQIYLNLPATNGPAKPTSIYLGTLGPFEISGAVHRAHMGNGKVNLRYPLGRILSGASVTGLSMMSVSFVRVNGDNAPKGGLIGLGEVRLETSTESETP